MKDNEIERWAGMLEEIDGDTQLFIELKTGAQFSGHLREIDFDGGFVRIRQEANCAIIIVRISEIAAIGIGCVWQHY